MNTENVNQIYSRVLEQLFTLWVNPEVQKRRSEGTISEDFKVYQAQVIFSLGYRPVIRLNNEIKLITKAKVNRPIKKNELVTANDIDEIQEVSLTHEEEDFGHISAFLFKENWIICFNFLYKTSESRKLFDIAKEFIKISETALNERQFRPFIENLSIAVENLVKARLYLIPDMEIRKTTTHRTTMSKVNHYFKDGIIKESFRNTFNELLHLRDKARYNNDFTYTKSKADNAMQEVNQFVQEIQSLFLKAPESMD